MSKKTYKDLMTDVAHYLNRTDQDTLSRIPTWIHLAESQLDRILRHPAAETVIAYTVPVGDDYIPVPRKLLELKQLRNAKTGEVLYRRSLETLYSTPLHSDYPTGYSRKSVRYILNKEVTEPFDVEIIFYAAPDHLAKPLDVNLYTMQCYDTLMYYAIAEGFTYLHDNESAQVYNSKAEVSFNMINQSIQREEFAGSTLVYFSDNELMNTYY